MQSLKGAFLLFAVWAISWPLSASQPQEENKSENTNDGIELTSVQTASFTPQTITNLNDSLQTISISAFKEQKKLENSSEISDVANIEQNSLSSEFVVNSNSNLNPEQKTKERAWNKIKQFLLFPKKNNATDLDKEGNLSKKAKKSNEENPKPMIFFKFAFKIRQIPLTNASAYSNDSKIINVKKLDFKPFPSNDLNPNLENERQRRESKSEKEVNEFFDDFPPFQDANINELFPKPESLFSDLLFHREPFSKFSQKKRDLKKQDSVDDVFKFFSEFFDKAFIKTEQELEERNPILDFLRGEEESKKEKNLFHTVGFDLKNSEKNPNLQERLQRNLKPLDQNSENDIIKSQENPVIIVDNVVKIEKVHLHNDGSNKFKSKKKKKRETKKHHNSKGVLHPALSVEPRQHKKTNLRSSKRSFKLVKEEKLKETPKRKRSHNAKLKEAGTIQLNAESKEIKVLPKENASTAIFGSNKTERDLEKYSEFLNTTENILDSAENLIKAIESFEKKVKKDLEDVVQKRESENSSSEKPLPKTPFYQDLEKNITKVLSQFLSWFKKLDNVKLELSEPLESFDWTEKETLQNSNIFGKRTKKNVDLVEKILSKEDETRQVADIYYLFLTVTLPTVIISLILLLVCYLNFQVKGRLCTTLFKPRPVLVIEDEDPAKRAIRSVVNAEKTQES